MNALLEAIARGDMSPLEEAEALSKLSAEGRTQQEIGRLIGKTQSYVSQKLRLLTLPDFLSVFLASGELTEGHVRQLLRLRDIYPADWFDSWRGATEAGLARAASIYYNFQPQAMNRPRWETVPQVAVDALRLLTGYVTKGKTGGPPLWSQGPVPSWSLSALWFAVDAVRERRSVAELSDEIDGWLDAVVADLKRQAEEGAA